MVNYLQMTSMKLLERDHFISELSELVEKVKYENGYVVSISGEAGIGKTTLVEFFTKQFEDKAKIYWGSCDDLFTPRPLAPLYDIAQQLNSKIIDQLDSGTARPSIFSNLLKEIQNSSPNIIVIEDVHWADESTLDLITFLGRRINKSSTLLIITYRDDELRSDHLLRIALGNLPSNNLKRIKLTLLSEEAVNKLAEHSGKIKPELYRLTGGNPLLVSEVLANNENVTSNSIKEMVTSKINKLPVESRNVIELLSVVPGKIEKWLIQKLVENFSIIDEGIESGLIKNDDDQISFRHDLIRLAIEETLTESKRIKFNSLVLNALLDQTNKEHLLARIIHHSAKSNNHDVIIKFTPIAAKQASNLGAHKLASKIYGTALQYKELISAEQQLNFLEGYSYECFLTGQVDEAIKSSEEALELFKKYPNPEREGEIYRRLSRILWYDCQDQKGEEALDKAITIFEKIPASRNLAMAYSNKSQTYAIREEQELIVKWGNKALELARKLNDKEVEAHALNNIGCGKMLLDKESGEEDLLRSLEISIKNEFYEQAIRAYVNLGALHLQRKKLSAADKYFEGGLEFSSEKDIYVYTLCMAGHYSKSKFHSGNWNEAVDLANSVLTKENLPPGNSVMPRTVIGLIRARRSDPGALSYIEKSFGLSFQMGELEKIVFVTSAKAEYYWLNNKLSMFADQLKSIYLQVLVSKNPWSIGELAYWLWKAGNLNEMPKTISKPYFLQIDGEWEEAAKLWEKLHCPYEQALALSEGDEYAMKQSLEIFEKLGATAAVQLIKQKMKESGIKSIPKGPRQSTKENFAGLTNRQLEVLKLVANGKSNSEIADNLYISAKTVDHHISAIFSKLNIHSRIEAATVLNTNSNIKK